jgi:hypothetical protein
VSEQTLNLYWTTAQDGSTQMDSSYIRHNDYSTIFNFSLLYSVLLCSTYHCSILFCSTLFYTPLHNLNDQNKVAAIPCSVTDSRRVEAHLVFRQNSHKVLQNNLPPNYLAESTERITLIVASIREVCVCFWLNSWELNVCQLSLSLLSDECVVVWNLHFIFHRSDWHHAQWSLQRG